MSLPASRSTAARPMGDVAWRKALPSWPLLLGLLVFARLLVERLSLLHDPDTYLHIAAGRWMLAHHALPTADPFSHSLPGAHWIATEWLAELGLALAYDQAGWGGVILLSAASVAVAVGLLAHFLLPRLDPLPALIAAVAAAALLLPHVLARPHVFALPVLVAWAGLLLRARDEGRSPPLMALPLILLWANIHGSFMFGLALAAFFAGEAVLSPRPGNSRRAEAARWGVFVAAAVAAALLTPYGIANFLQQVRLTQMPTLQATFAEWVSPDFQKSPALDLWIVGLIGLGYLTGLRLPPARLVLLLGLVHMTLQHGRHGDLLAVVVPLAIAAPLGRHLAALTAGEAPSGLSTRLAELARPAGLPALTLTLAVAAAIALPTALRPIERVDDAVTPASALAKARQAGLAGPVFNSEGFGGYLMFRGVPTFIDGRIEMYGDAFLADDYAAERGDEAVLTRLLDRYRIGWTVFTPAAGAVLVMDHLAGWERVYSDNWAVVHRRIAAPPLQ